MVKILHDKTKKALLRLRNNPTVASAWKSLHLALCCLALFRQQPPSLPASSGQHPVSHPSFSFKRRSLFFSSHSLVNLLHPFIPLPHTCDIVTLTRIHSQSPRSSPGSRTPRVYPTSQPRLSISYFFSVQRNGSRMSQGLQHCPQWHVPGP